MLGAGVAVVLELPSLRNVSPGNRPCLHSSIAEQLPCKQWVEGASPSGGFMNGIAQLVERWACNPCQPGSGIFGTDQPK